MRGPGTKRFRRLALFALAALVLVASGLWWWADASDRAGRERVLEAITDMGVARVEAVEHFSARGRFPSPRTIATPSRHLGSLRLEPEGRIVGILAAPDVAEIDGKRVVFEPRIEGPRIAEWRCRSDAAPRYLPAHCRGLASGPS